MFFSTIVENQGIKETVALFCLHRYTFFGIPLTALTLGWHHPFLGEPYYTSYEDLLYYHSFIFSVVVAIKYT